MSTNGIRTYTCNEGNKSKQLEPEECTGDNQEVIKQNTCNDYMAPTTFNQEEYMCNQTSKSDHTMHSHCHNPTNTITNTTLVQDFKDDINDNSNSAPDDTVVACVESDAVSIDRTLQYVDQAVGSVKLQSVKVDNINGIEDCTHYKQKARFWFIVASTLAIMLGVVILIVLLLVTVPKREEMYANAEGDKNNPMQPGNRPGFLQGTPFDQNPSDLMLVTQHAFIFDTDLDCPSFVSQSDIPQADMIIGCMDGSGKKKCGSYILRDVVP
jgi:hypothetical protein